jgi:hypothetical protein
MNCAKVHRHLLASENPGQPAADAALHLARCGTCSALQRRLVAVEQKLPLLPVPPSTRRDSFVRQVQRGEPILEPTISTSDLWLSARPPAKERGLKKLALAFALAAGLVVFALGWWAWPHKNTSGQRAVDPIVLRQQQRDRKLATADTPQKRIVILNDLAGQLHEEARQLVLRRDDDQLRVVARFFTEVVSVNLLDDARLLPPEERTKVLRAVAVHLAEVESSIQRMRADAPAGSAGPLNDIALASSRGHHALQKLIESAA